jgi:hypothetical protein
MSSRRPFIVSSVVAVTALSLLAAGCGGGGSPRVATVGSAPTTTATPAQQAQNEVIAFATCMRHHGVPDLPDPTASPRGFKEAMNNSSPVFQSALSTCQHLLPNGGRPEGPTITPADRTAYLRATACMRSHGFPNFPDPSFQGNTVTINLPSNVNKNSPQAVSAVNTCRKLIPAGLPYSGTDGG